MNPLKLPFDQYQRYRVVADAVEAVRSEGRPLSILDVGGSPGLILDFLPTDRIVILDMTESSRGRCIRGDGTRLPFHDRAFDVVTSVDVLEHIAPPARRTFMEEIKRVSKKYVFIAAPLRSESVVEAERLLFETLKASTGREHAFLKEHLEYGLPEKGETISILKEGGWETLAVPNGALKRWLPMMALSLYMEGDPFLCTLTGRVNAFYNANYYVDDNCSPSYRSLLAVARQGFTKEASSAIRGLESKKGMEKELDLSWLSLFVDLFGYRDLREAREAERLEFRKVIEARERHIDSLKETVEARERHIDSLKETVRKKDSRIERQRKTIEALQRRLEALEESRGVKVLKGLGVIKNPGSEGRR